MRWRWLAGSLAWLLWFLPWIGGNGAVASAGAQAEAPASLEYKVKAAFLYNFAKFTDWPGSGDDPGDGMLDICVLGRDPFGTALDALAGRRVGPRLVQVHRIEEQAGYGHCEVVFISRSEQGRLAAYLVAYRNRPVLTVSDIESFARQGGMIELVIVSGRIRFKINLDAARRQGIRLDATLLNLALEVLR